MGRLFAESRAALARGTPRPRNTKDRPVGGLHVPADRGTDLCLATLILPDKPPSRQVENAGFRQRRSYVACALPLCGGVFSPKGKSCPQFSPPRPRLPLSRRSVNLHLSPRCPSPCPAGGQADRGG